MPEEFQSKPLTRRKATSSSETKVLSPDARLIPAGFECGRSASHSQTEINFFTAANWKDLAMIQEERGVLLHPSATQHENERCVWQKNRFSVYKQRLSRLVPRSRESSGFSCEVGEGLGVASTYFSAALYFTAIRLKFTPTHLWLPPCFYCSVPSYKVWDVYDDPWFFQRKLWHCPTYMFKNHEPGHSKSQIGLKA